MGDGVTTCALCTVTGSLSGSPYGPLTETHTFHEASPQPEMPPAGPGGLQPARSNHSHTVNTAPPLTATSEHPVLCTCLSHQTLLSGPFLKDAQIF